MPPSRPLTPARPSLALRLGRIAMGGLLATVLASFIAALAADSLGAMLRLAPALVLGIPCLLLLFWWPSAGRPTARIWLVAATLFAFVILSVLSIGTLWKFIQPTVLPKKVVPDGNPWVIEGNIFTDNNYNNPVVVPMADGRYRMYFHDSDRLVSAISADGKQFTLEGTLFTGEMPTVIKLADGRYRMYFFRNPDRPAPGPAQPGSSTVRTAPKHNLYSALSSDGLHWTEEAGIRLSPTPGGYDQDTMIHPSVIQLADGSYKLYYDGETEEPSPYAMVIKYRKIMSASSTDGLTWAKDPGYRIDEKPLHTWEAYSPKALYKDGKVILHFTTPNGIYAAESSDTLHFKISKQPVFSPGRVPMPDGDNGVRGSYQDAFVLPVSGGNRIYFWINGQGLFSAFQQG